MPSVVYFARLQNGRLSKLGYGRRQNSEMRWFQCQSLMWWTCVAVENGR